MGVLQAEANPSSGWGRDARDALEGEENAHDGLFNSRAARDAISGLMQQRAVINISSIEHVIVLIEQPIMLH
jgi:hypothetical protein